MCSYQMQLCIRIAGNKGDAFAGFFIGVSVIDKPVNESLHLNGARLNSVCCQVGVLFHFIAPSFCLFAVHLSTVQNCAKDPSERIQLSAPFLNCILQTFIAKYTHDILWLPSVA